MRRSFLGGYSGRGSGAGGRGLRAPKRTPRAYSLATVELLEARELMASAVYDAARNEVDLVPKKPFALAKSVRLTIIGMPSVDLENSTDRSNRR
jgi:hypothetical protein